MNEHLSAWMDGELSDEQTRLLLSQVKLDASLRTNWNCYHLIRDALHGVHGPDLCARIFARLDAEPTVLALLRRSKTAIIDWRSLQLAASIAVLVVSGGIWIFLPDLQQNLPQIAASPAPKVKQVAVPAGDDERGYLFAHQYYSPSSTLHGVVAYVRIVSPEIRSRADRLVN